MLYSFELETVVGESVMLISNTGSQIPQETCVSIRSPGDLNDIKV